MGEIPYVLRVLSNRNNNYNNTRLMATSDTLHIEISETQSLGLYLAVICYSLQRKLVGLRSTYLVRHACRTMSVMRDETIWTVLS